MTTPRKYSTVDTQEILSTSVEGNVSGIHPDQLDIMEMFDVTRMHKMDRLLAHTQAGVADHPGDFKVVAYDGESYTSKCLVCGLGVKSTLSECKVSK